MAIMRAKSRLTTAALPPSPIPTGRGSRSASNDNFTKFLDNCLKIPDLTSVPPSHFSASSSRHQFPDDIDLRSLSADAIARLLVSAKQFGACRISHHGILAEELGSVIREAESIFGNAGALAKRFVERNGNREEIKCSPELLMEKKCRDFCKSMEKVASKVEAIGEQLMQVSFGNVEKKFEKSSSGFGEVRLFRYHHQEHSMNRNRSIQNLPTEEILSGNNNNKNFHMRDCDDHALCLHLPLEHSQFNIQLEGGPALLFNAGPETLVVTVGKQLEGFKCVSGEMIFDPDISSSQASFSIQLKVPLFSNSRKKSKTVSIADQILFTVVLFLLYKIAVFIYIYIYTHITTTTTTRTTIT